MRAGDAGGMTSNPHPAVEARRRRTHHIRRGVATAATGLFIAIFSVIYAQMPATAKTTTAQHRSATSSSSSTASSAMPMTTTQS